MSKVPFIQNPVYLSYTSLNDFLKCPSTYYLKNVYRNPKNGYRLQLASPYLSLGSTVHDTISWYISLNKKPEFDEVVKKFKNLWLKFHGKRGGFSSTQEEAIFGKRGIEMLGNFIKNFKTLERVVKPLYFPKIHLVEDLVLLGNIDYVGEMEDSTLHIIDFKTGTKDEDSPLQLYIYALLAESNYGKKVSKISFWYLDRDNDPKEAVLDPLDQTLDWLKEQATEVKEAIREGSWQCIKPGRCNECVLYQMLIDGKGEFLFSDHKFKKDIYYLDKTKNN